MKRTKKLLSLLMFSLLTVGAVSGCKGDDNNSSKPSSSSSNLLPPSSSSTITNKHYDGQGAPLDSFGINGDTYKDTLTNNEYVKVNGHWLMIGNSNPQTLTGEGTPSSQLGNNGDYYTDTTNGNYYHKQNGQWVLIKEGENKQTHTVVFDLNGGEMPDGSISIPSQSVVNGEWVKKPTQDPTKKNSTFLGWFVDGEDSKWSFTNSVYGDLVLVAKYSVNEDEKVVLNVNPNNGEKTYSVESFSGDVPRITIPSKEGFNFVGWFFTDTNEQFLGTISVEMNGKTIIARFEKSTFNLTYQVENDNTVTITGLLNINEVNLIIPSTIDGYTVTAIGEKAFQNRIYLSSITLPSTIKTINSQAFRGARMLATVNVDSTNPYFTSKDGVLYSKDMKKLVLCPAKNTTKFSVPGSVEIIGDYSFYGHKDGGVNEIIFNEGLVEIGVRAFYENTSLKTLRFPSTLRKIGDGAFNCVSSVGNIQSVHFNDGLEEIGDSAFVGAYFKEAFSLPSSVRKIGSYAFANCTAITKFTFPASLEEFNATAFAGATGILEIAIENGNQNFVINDNILYTKDMKKVVMCPSGRRDPVSVPEGVEVIADYAFYMVDGCQEYSFPSTLKTIGKQAFAHCYELREFTIPDSVTSIGENCFDLCESLTTVNIGKGLTEIPKQAFIECYSLTNIDIPDTIQKIGSQAFLGCTGLKEFGLKEGLKEIGSGAFYFSTTEYNLNDKPAITNLNIPNSVEYLGENAFANQSALTTVTIGSGLKYFGSGAFEGAPVTSLSISSENPNFTADNQILYSKDKQVLYFALTSLTGEVTLPSGLKTINAYAFKGCKTITAMNFPESLEEIKEGAFVSTRIANLEFKSGLKKIGDGAFSMGFIKTISFAEGIEEIGASAFSQVDITALSLPDSLKILGEGAFSRCIGLVSLDLGNGLEEIGDHAFYNCKKITGEVKFPATLKKLGVGLFVNNVSITEFDFTGNQNFVSEDGLVMDSDRTIVYAYAPAHSATTLTLPSTIQVINDYAFTDAKKLITLTLPNGLTTIKSFAFSNMIKVVNLVIPSTVTYVGEGAFTNWGYSSAQKITFSCTQDYALMHFDTQYLSGIKESGTTVSYNG